MLVSDVVVIGDINVKKEQEAILATWRSMEKKRQVEDSKNCKEETVGQQLRYRVILLEP